MCGRTCLTLSKSEIKCACSYLTKSFEEEEPNWRPEFNFNKTYNPSFNIAPSDITPVIVSSKHFDDGEECDSERVMVPMMWGIIPSWHKGDYKKHGLSTNNCRLENLLTSKLYKPLLEKGQRCVVVCEGFYEWQTTKNCKQSERAAYYIYMVQNENIKIEHPGTWNPDEIKLLKFAGLFDEWTDEMGDKIYSYAIITFESPKTFAWMHNRYPAILETEQQISDWLDFNRVGKSQALQLLQPAQNITWHRVSNMVNNVRNKSNLCNKPVEDASKQSTSKLIHSWLNKKRSIIEQEDEKEPKKTCLET